MVGERAAYQAHIEEAPAGVVSLVMSEHIEFSLQEGIVKYSGGWDMVGKKEGLGIQLWDDGTLYAGTWKEGKQHVSVLVFVFLRACALQGQGIYWGDEIL